MHPLRASFVRADDQGRNRLAEHNDIAPFERRAARKWTRVADYWSDAESSVIIVEWASRPNALADYPGKLRQDVPRNSRRGLLFPAAAVAVAAILSLWGSGVLERSDRTQSAASTSTSRGLVFGLCTDGGLTNCVASGDSFYLGGKTVRIAGIEAPAIYGALCPKEASAGRTAASKLRDILNSGEIETSKTNHDLDRYGLLLRNVAVDGKDVGHLMVGAGLARTIGDMTRSWC